MKNTHEFQDEEIWKEIKGYEGLYAVSSKGRVMNLKTGKMLKNMIEPHGYAFVDLYKGDGTSKKIKIHRLVATAFIPNPLNLPQINHIDECKTNNNVSNLGWCTASENVRHSIYQQSCCINQLTLDGKFIKQWESAREINRELGYSNGNIVSCCKGKFKQMYGFRWQYANTTQQKRQNRPVAALTKDGEFIAEYKNAAEAARCLKIRDGLIRKCLRGIYKSTNGLIFIYID